MNSSHPAEDVAPLAESSKRLAQRLFIIGENRLQLLLVEAQEEREKILRALWLGLIGAAFALLAGVTLTLIVAIAFWEFSPVTALAALAVIYVIAAAGFYAKLSALQRNWQTLPATIEQLKKDRECLEKQLG